ncbi:helix-turn-helix transcriptional regulator [Mycobacterium sp. URHB0044]|uniref:helix-turn-helix transcriptional regulator n=1 Tax=Mycobacterium sp. URHB0044 TaxID=1380386 RepID=UPI000491D3B6|nr:helix-turn-helix transcriptional regulator [Mycobacterium sp. URHB0044]
MVTVEDFSRIVSGIYAAAVAPQHWEAAIREVHQTVGGIGGALATPDGAVWSIENTTLPDATMKSYAEHYRHLDHVLATVQRGPVGVVRTGTELIVPNRWSEFYNCWMRPNDLLDGLFVRLTGGPRPTIFIVASSDDSAPFDTPERVKFLSGLTPHLQQAVRAQAKLSAFTQLNADLAGALDAVRHGMILVGLDGVVINANSAAERMLRAEDGLRMRSGHLGAMTTHVGRKLRGAIHFALLDDESDTCRGQSFTCDRPSGRRPYVVHVLPLRRGPTDEIPSDAAALVMIVDPDNEPEPTAVQLQRVYGLTNAEVKVTLAVVRGDDLHQISDQLSVSITTVRTHLQHIFDKTDTHRQAELVRRLLTLSP